MYNMRIIVLISVTLCIYMVSVCVCSSTLEIRLVSYNNTGAILLDGKPCEAPLGIVGQCDHVFVFCLDYYPSAMVFDNCNCPLLYNKTEVFMGNTTGTYWLDRLTNSSFWDRLTNSSLWDRDSNSSRWAGGTNSSWWDGISNSSDWYVPYTDDVINVFGDDMNGVPNPIVISDLAWSGIVSFMVNIWEHDGNSLSNLADIIQETIELDPDPDEASSLWISHTYYGQRQNSSSSLHVSLRLYCEDGYIGPHCDCKPVDCNTEGHYTCDHETGKICLPGWANTSNNCMTSEDDCLHNPCHHNNQCLDGHMTYTCLCDAGYTGTHCETNIDECESSPCLHQSTCTDRINSFTCNCTSGYAGSSCKHVACDANHVCNNNGTCGVISGACSCSYGYGDPYCDTYLCDVISCLNGGTCQGDHCTCAEGYTGTACEFPLCAFTNCLHGGFCVPETGECYCSDFYTGVFCESSLGVCLLDCGDDGMCIEGVCKCFQGYTGQLCELQIIEGTPWQLQVTIGICCAVVCATIVTGTIITTRRVKKKQGVAKDMILMTEMTSTN